MKPVTIETVRERLSYLEGLNERGVGTAVSQQQFETACLRELLTLLDDLVAAEKRIAELERSETQLIDERDNAESALNDAYKAVMGQAPEWSNWFSFENAIDEIELVCELWRNQTDDVIQFRQRIAELEAREIKPSKGEVLVTVSGFTGCGKSAIAGEIEIAMKAIGVPVQWSNGDAEKRMTRADWLTAIEMYRPTVRIVEVNVPRAAGIKVEGE